MKITLKCEHNECTITSELSEDLSLPELMSELRTFLIAIGYHPNNISDYIEEE